MVLHNTLGSHNNTHTHIPGILSVIISLLNTRLHNKYDGTYSHTFEYVMTLAHKNAKQIPIDTNIQTQPQT